MTLALGRSYHLQSLGSTPRYDVYDIVLYPDIVYDLTAQSDYRDALRSCLWRAKAARRKVWIVVGLQGLAPGELMRLFAAIVLPFVGQPLVSRTYGAPHTDQFRDFPEFPFALYFLQHFFDYAAVAQRSAGLPPEL